MVNRKNINLNTRVIDSSYKKLRKTCGSVLRDIVAWSNKEYYFIRNVLWNDIAIRESVKVILNVGYNMF